MKREEHSPPAEASVLQHQHEVAPISAGFPNLDLAAVEDKARTVIKRQ